MGNKENNQNLIIYSFDDKEISVEVRLQDDSVWLTQSQMSELFDKDSNTISEHIQNIFAEGEVDRSQTTRDFRVVRKEGNREISRNITHYNLDVIISVGYRVKSLRGTHFRIWATSILRQHIIDGYTINQQRLEQVNEKWESLKAQMNNLRGVLDTKSLTNSQSQSLIRVITDYTKALELIDLVDRNSVPAIKGKIKTKPLNYDEILKEVDELRVKLNAGTLFGQDMKDGLRGAINSIEQSIGGNPVYGSVEGKAANLLYLIIKNHPFADGNKRIGSFAFIRYLDINGLLYRENGTKRIEQDTLVAIALLIAQSKSTEKDLMTDLVMYLIGLE